MIIPTFLSKFINDLYLKRLPVKEVEKFIEKKWLSMDLERLNSGNFFPQYKITNEEDGAYIVIHYGDFLMDTFSNRGKPLSKEQLFAINALFRQFQHRVYRNLKERGLI